MQGYHGAILESMILYRQANTCNDTLDQQMA